MTNNNIFILIFITLITIGGLHYISSGDQFQKDIDFFQKSTTDSQNYNQEYLDNFFKQIEENDVKQYESGQQELENIVTDSLEYSSIKTKFQDYCLNGLKGSDLSEKEKLEAFVKGKCSPAVLLPGIMGSALQFQIDCETLQKEEPEIFASCGWSRCDKKWYDNFLSSSVPQPEYRAWLPEILNPSSVVTLRENGKLGKCYGNLIQLRRTKDSQGKVEWQEPKGIKVKIVGFTPETTNNSKCGNSGVSNLAANSSINAINCSVKGYKKMIEILEAMGYQEGLTYQSMPYDFRYAIEFSTTKEILEKSLTSLKYVTGKKSVIISHSYGSPNTLNALSQFSQEFKDQNINQWVPTGAPFSGAPKLIKLLLNKSDQTMIKSFGSIFGKEITLGIQYHSQSKMVESTSSSFDLLIKNTMSIPEIREQKWMQEILNRIAYEKGDYTGQNVPLDFFPTKESICRPNQEGNNSLCNTNLLDFSEDYFVKVEDKEYKFNKKDIEQLLKEHATPETLEQYQQAKQEVLETLPNPGVKVTNVYGNFLDVEYQYFYDTSPLPFTLEEKFKFPETVKNTRGDGTVTSTSALLGPIKWKIEHDENQENAKPIRFVELCSSYNSTLNVNTERDSNGELTFTESGYNGLECKCMDNNKYDNCEHSCMISDLTYLEFIANILSSEAKSVYQQETMVEDFEIQQKMVTCDNLQL